MLSKRAPLEKFTVKIFQILAMSLFVILNYYSIGLTEESIEITNEDVFQTSDSLVGNIFWICVALLFFFIVQQLILRYAENWNMQLIAAIISIVTALCCVYWVGASSAVPYADQEKISIFADAFNNGDYTGFERGNYVGLYPHQLGLITLTRILFYFFGAGNYHAFQYMSALLAGTVVFFGYQVVKHLSNHQKTAEAYYLLLAVSCVPLYGYTPYVYGEIISTSLLLLSAWMLLSCLKNFSWGKAVIFALSSGIAVQMRENSLIVLIGFFIVLAVKLITGNTKIMTRLLVSMAIGILLPWSVIHGMYDDKIPPDSNAVPTILYFAMGLNWDYVNPGWFNGYNYVAYMQNDFDVDASKEAAKDKIREFVQTVKEDDGYAVNFYVHKLTSQWSAPMYQCLVMNSHIEGEQSRLAHSVYFGRLRGICEKFMNIYQLLVYGGVLVALFVKRKEWTYLDNHVLLIGIFGGFLFSMIWEAKARYIFPYLIFMLPYAAIGLASIDLKNLIKRENL